MSKLLFWLFTKLRSLVVAICDILKFGFRYPSLLILTALVVLVVWGRLLTGFDGPHVLWDESWWSGISAGFAAAALFALFFHFFYVLHICPDLSIKNEASPAFRYWSVTLVLSASVPQWTVDGFTDQRWAARIWFPVGMAIAWVLVWLLRDPPKSSDTTTAVPPPTRRGWFRWMFSETRNMPFGRLFLRSMGVVFVAFLLLYIAVCESWLGGSAVFGAGFLSLLALYFLLGVLGMGHYLAVRSGYKHVLNYSVGFGIVILYLISVAVQNVRPYTYFEVEHEVRGIDRKEGSYYDRPVEWNVQKYEDLSPEDPLRKDETVLAKWKAYTDDYFTSTMQTKLNIVTVSGGASTSALYVADMLYGLEIRNPGFIDRTRLITGASGGMLGAAYFVSRMHPASNPVGDEITRLRTNYLKAVREFRKKAIDKAAFIEAEKTYGDGLEAYRDQFMEPLKADYLSPLMQAWLAKDIPEAVIAPVEALALSFFQKDTARIRRRVDRGSALEEAWVRKMPSLGKPFSLLETDELEGKLPSLVFTPMTVEDGRQVLISNLDLDYMTRTVGPTPPGASPQETWTAVEFGRLFPEARKFRLCTAVRLQASFPFFSPPAFLPTNPTRRVVDAGYYDNYGLIVACRWLEEHRGWLEANKVTPRVYHLWSYGYGRNGTSLETADEERQRETTPGSTVIIHPGFSTFSGPVGGLLTSWKSNMAYRGEERLNGIMQRFAESNARLRLPATRYRLEMTDFLPAGVDAEFPMNWYLGPRNIDSIAKSARAALASVMPETTEGLQNDPMDVVRVQKARREFRADIEKAKDPAKKAPIANVLFDLDLESRLMRDPRNIPDQAVRNLKAQDEDKTPKK